MPAVVVASGLQTARSWALSATASGVGGGCCGGRSAPHAASTSAATAAAIAVERGRADPRGAQGSLTARGSAGGALGFTGGRRGPPGCLASALGGRRFGVRAAGRRSPCRVAGRVLAMRERTQGLVVLLACDLPQGARLSQHFAGRWANCVGFLSESGRNSTQFANCPGSAALSAAKPGQLGKHARTSGRQPSGLPPSLPNRDLERERETGARRRGRRRDPGAADAEHLAARTQTRPRRRGRHTPPAQAGARRPTTAAPAGVQ
jgi:hypothetical protein